MEWERDVRLGEWTRYRIGGSTPRFARVDDLAGLGEAMRALEGRPYRVLGGGANLLVADRGIGDAVLKLGGGFDWTRVEAGTFEAGGAASLPGLARTARENAFEGFVFLEAVPGTLGGGLRMNAGSRDEWIWHRVEWAEAVTPEREVERVTPEEARPSYRHVDLPESWIFVRARFEARSGDREGIAREHREFRSRKVEAQVYDLRSVGSTWKNPGPPHGSAWSVVDRVGMRGARSGGAQISEKHANFIVNHGEARAEDVLSLMAETYRRVRGELGIELRPEIRLWGFTDEEVRSVGGAA